MNFPVCKRNNWRLSIWNKDLFWVWESLIPNIFKRFIGFLLYLLGNSKIWCVNEPRTVSRNVHTGVIYFTTYPFKIQLFIPKLITYLLGRYLFLKSNHIFIPISKIKSYFFIFFLTDLTYRPTLTMPHAYGKQFWTQKNG